MLPLLVARCWSLTRNCVLAAVLSPLWWQGRGGQLRNSQLLQHLQERVSFLFHDVFFKAITLEKEPNENILLHALKTIIKLRIDSSL